MRMTVQLSNAHSRVNGVLISVALLSALTPCVGVQAEESDQAAAKRTARKQFEIGMNRIAEEDYHGALEAFEEAHRIRPKPHVLYNIAMCQKALFLYTQALETFEHYLQRAGDTPTPDLRQPAAKAISQIEQLVGRLRIEAIPEDATISVDGQREGTTPLTSPILLNPGHHTVRIEAAGYQPYESGVTVVSGAEVRLSAELLPKSARLSVNCTPANEAVVRLNDLEVGPCPYSADVAYGDYTVRVEAPGHRVFTRQAALESDQGVEINAILEQLPQPDLEHPGVSGGSAVVIAPKSLTELNKSIRTGKRSKYFLPGVIAASAGLCGAVVGLIFNIKGQRDYEKALELKKDWENSVPTNDSYRVRYNKLANETVPNDQIGMIIGYASAAALLTTGTILLFKDHRHTQKTSKRMDVTLSPTGLSIVF